LIYRQLQIYAHAFGERSRFWGTYAHAFGELRSRFWGTTLTLLGNYAHAFGEVFFIDVHLFFSLLYFLER